MNKLALILVLGLTGAAAAQPAPAPPAGDTQPAPPAASPAADAHKACVDALNADPALAKRVVETYNKKAVEAIDQQTIDAHKRAAADIAENERHVIYAYAVMWIVAALFLVYMWRRQQGLKTELAQLRRELDAAAKGDAK
ncbi:MAG TPA: hypothetical protein VIV40_40520 [Kofleriaceae bacterium]